MKRKIVCILVPIIVGIITVIFLNSFLDKNVQEMLEKKDLQEINIAYGSMYKDRGVVYNNYLMKNNYLSLQGSSEFVVPVSQLPTKIFPAKGMEKVVTNGRAYFQTINHTELLGSESNWNKDSKVALFLSLQWFCDEGGIEPKNFQANFAPIQFYKYLSNPKISDKNKKKYATRVNDLLEGNTQFAAEEIYSKLYINDGFVYKIAKALFTPYFICREKMVELKDKGLLYRRLELLNDKKPEEELKEINWGEEEKKAEEEAKTKETNNDFYVDDNFYNKYLKDNLKAHKDSKKNIDLMKSKEFEDYELYLDTCIDLGVKPYIILIPTNGRWYDHTGMTKETRDNFYDIAQKIAEEKGFKVLNLKDEEYTPYFMYDIMHLGWKGWIKVEEELYKHYNEK
ncbi:D-alanyl-lipoteichoic acid biosynthesis protein DltD [Clostridium sp. C2-6-12]|uniref:D-alanyl-lipoteichoic acid biosynthesis protein DltD n=1 Tax=Clostridium sp. C2-6-12 TaxID=2698832 RepID=UPI00136DED8D|nr:D-alanyl-lipoteichoic acid biosynthesis protein DltD [Clostridium sp. C2-6-12]